VRQASGPTARSIAARSARPSRWPARRPGLARRPPGKLSSDRSMTAIANFGWLQTNHESGFSREGVLRRATLRTRSTTRCNTFTGARPLTRGRALLALWKLFGCAKCQRNKDAVDAAVPVMASNLRLVRKDLNADRRAPEVSALCVGFHIAASLSLALSGGRRAKQGGNRKQAKRACGRPFELVVGRHLLRTRILGRVIIERSLPSSLSRMTA
jgi:hypothetical protein